MPIEVILKQPVQGLGAEADIVKVKAGYARNYLIPNNIAAQATAASKKEIEALQKRRAEREADELQKAETLAAALNKVTITFQMESAEGSGKLFGSVTSQDISERLATMGHELDRKKIQLDRPLKDVGEKTIKANLGMDVTATFKVVLATAESEAKES
ncbi:MAG: 50S ribosomal protein L9 [Verrucomicrobiota bacterium]